MVQIPPISTVTTVSRIGTIGPFTRRIGAARIGRVARSIVMWVSARGRQLGPSQNRAGAVNTWQGVVPSIATRASKPGKIHGRLRISCGVAGMRGEVARLLPHQLRQPRRQHQPRQPCQARQPCQNQHPRRLNPPHPRRRPLLQRRLQPGRLYHARLSRQNHRSSASLWQGRDSRSKA